MLLHFDVQGILLSEAFDARRLGVETRVVVAHVLLLAWLVLHCEFPALSHLVARCIVDNDGLLCPLGQFLLGNL